VVLRKLVGKFGDMCLVISTTSLEVG